MDGSVTPVSRHVSPFINCLDIVYCTQQKRDVFYVKPANLIQQLFISIFKLKLFFNDENLASGIFLFFSYSATVPPFQEVPGVVAVLVHHVQYSEWQFHENIWGRFIISCTGIPG